MRTPKIRPRHLVTGAALLAAALLGGVAHAAPPQPGADLEPGRRGGGPCAHLQCTEDQKQELRDIFKELRQDMKQEHEAMKAIHQELAAEFKKDKPNEAEMKRLYAQMDKIHAVMRDRRHDAMMEAHAVLTPEQRAQAADHMMRMGPPPPHDKRGKRNGKNAKRKAQ